MSGLDGFARKAVESAAMTAAGVVGRAFIRSFERALPPMEPPERGQFDPVEFAGLEDELRALEPTLRDTDAFFIVEFGATGEYYVQAMRINPDRITVEAHVPSGYPMPTWPEGLDLRPVASVSDGSYTQYGVEVPPERVAATAVALIRAYAIESPEVQLRFEPNTVVATGQPDDLMAPLRRGCLPRIFARLIDVEFGGRVNRTQPGNVMTIDACRFRRDQHCYHHRRLDLGASRTEGFPVSVPEDRGICPWGSHADQELCPLMEHGPGAVGELRRLGRLDRIAIRPDATVPHAAGGQRAGVDLLGPEALSRSYEAPVTNWHWIRRVDVEADGSHRFQYADERLDTGVVGPLPAPADGDADEPGHAAVHVWESGPRTFGVAYRCGGCGALGCATQACPAWQWEELGRGYPRAIDLLEATCRSCGSNLKRLWTPSGERGPASR